MALRIHHSNRVEVLRDRLAETLEHPPEGAGPLEAEWVLLDNPSLGPWIKLQLALEHGVAANVHTVVLDEFFWTLARHVVSDDIPARTPLSKEEMTWRLLGLLEDPEQMAEEDLAPVRHYLAGDEAGAGHAYEDLKRYQLAARLADLFDQYLVYRPDWIARWDDGEPVEGSVTGGRSRAAETWQRRLWRGLADRVSGRSPDLRHRAHIHRELCRRLLRDDPLHLPFRRLCVFGVTAMSPGDLDMLMLLAAHVDVDLFVPDPCREFWFDVRSERRIMHLRRKEGATPEVEIGNPLLAAQGRQVQDFLNLLLVKEDPHRERARIESASLHVDPGEDRGESLLTCIQQDILNLQFRGDYAQYAKRQGTPRRVPRADDGSVDVHIHNCHGPLREVEVLHDQLLALFREHPDLSPRDVVVMMPRVGPYAPCIQAVFESAEPRIPYHVNDRSLQEESPILNSFQDLLELPDSRLPLSGVLGLLEVPAIHRRFGLARADYETLRQWLIASGVRWGEDAAHREREVDVAYRDFSWDFGLDRLLAGYAMQAGDDHMPGGVMPLDEIEGGDAAILDGFLAFWERLEQWRGRLGVPRSPGKWHAALLRLLDDFYAPDVDDRRAFDALREGIDTLQAAGEEGWHDGTVSPETLRAAVQPVLDRVRDRRHPWSEGVKFCSLLPMRGVPFEVVYLLGMNMEDYPRRVDRPSFDLMRDDYRPGDRSARIDDRWLFLEALLSARRAFHVSYTGQDIHRNEPREPSVLVTELIDTIREGFRSDDWFSERKLVENTALYSRHPLQPFNPAYFRDPETVRKGGDRRLSFHRGAWAVARMQRETRGAASDPCTRRWPETPDEGPAPGEVVEVDLDDFLDFFADPPAWFFRRRGVSLNRYEELASDEEPWELEAGLGTWQAIDTLLRRIDAAPPLPANADRETEKARAIEAMIEASKGEGSWPAGAQGERSILEAFDKLTPAYLFLHQGRKTTWEDLDLAADVAVEAGEAPVRLRVTGRERLHGGDFLLRSASRKSAKHLLRFYLRAALLAAGDEGAPPWSEARVCFRDTRDLGRAATVILENTKFPTVLDASVGLTVTGRDLLRDLAALFLRHRATGLPFHPDISLKLQLDRSADPEALAEQTWSGAYDPRRIEKDARARAYYGSPATLCCDAFVGVSRALWKTVLTWARQEADA